MIVAAPALLLGVTACLAFAIRKRLPYVAGLTIAAIAIAGVLVATRSNDATGELLGVALRMSPLGRLAAVTLLAILGLLVIDVAVAQPAYNFFPTALAIGAVAVGVLILASPLLIFSLLLVGLLIPVGSFTYQIDRNRSVEAALRHFSFVVLGGCLGLGALALAIGLPKDQPAQTIVLLVVLIFIAFALMLAAIPFHTHAALLASEAPAAALGLYFGVLVPLTFIASEPHTPSRQDRRKLSVSSCALMAIKASSSMFPAGSISSSTSCM